MLTSDINYGLTLITNQTKSLLKNLIHVGKLLLRNLYASLNVTGCILVGKKSWESTTFCEKGVLNGKDTKRSAMYSYPVESILLFKLESRVDKDLLCIQHVPGPSQAFLKDKRNQESELAFLP